VQSYQVFRASRDAPDLTDGRGWTYHHHVDMACWRGRLYVGWNSCERDEDVWPSRELYSTSADGATWSLPAELFPQGVSTPLRMYFFHAPNGRMLAIAGLRVDTGETSEDAKGGVVVREIRSDHTLGDVFTLQPAASGVTGGPRFDQAGDAGFVEACRHLLADHVYLEQQDRGRLLGSRRMRWHDPASWPGGKIPGDSDKWVAGKAFSFFRRADGALVGISKMGWTTISRDDGTTWSQPVVPPSLVTGKAKVWAQQTADGRYALVYNPSTRTRFPLAVVTSDDGIRFSGMRIVQGEMPVQRYEGRFRSIGPQYVRGVSRWSDDGSRAGEGAMWLVYSMSKEDIWVSRVPLPVRPDETARGLGDEHFARWNVYRPRWCDVSVDGGTLRLEDRDPYDYARATRLFPSSRRVSASFAVRADQPGGTLELELVGGFGSPRPVRVTFAGDDRQNLSAWTRFDVEADVDRQRFSVVRDGRRVVEDAALAEPADALSRISFRTGPHRGIGGTHPVEPGSDRMTEPVAFAIRDVRVVPS